jgi:hypothetical protein
VVWRLHALLGAPGHAAMPAVGVCGQVPTARCVSPSSLPFYFTAPASRPAARSILATFLLSFSAFFLGLLRLVVRLQEEWNSATGLQSDIMRAKKSWLTIGVACCAERDNVVVERSGNGMSYLFSSVLLALLPAVSKAVVYCPCLLRQVKSTPLQHLH